MEDILGLSYRQQDSMRPCLQTVSGLLSLNCGRGLPLLTSAVTFSIFLKDSINHSVCF